ETLSDISQRGGLIVVVPAGNEIYPTLGTTLAITNLSKKIQSTAQQGTKS
ncbi:MAG: slipin family protein, partial [Saccharolobus sp.]